MDHWAYYVGAISALHAVDYIIDRKQKLPTDLNFAPLLDVAAFYKARGNFLCAADTGHDDLVVQATINSPDLARGFAKLGYTDIFREADKAIEGAVLGYKLYENKDKLFREFSRIKLNSFIWSSPNKQLMKGLAEIVVEGKIKQHFIDGRADILMRRLPTFDALTCLLLSSAMQCVMPRNSFPSYVAAKWLERSKRVDRLSETVVLDDRAAMDRLIAHTPNVRSSDPSAVLIYGLGHFCGRADALGVPSFLNLLKRYGQKPVVVGVYSSLKQRSRTEQQMKKRAGGHYLPTQVDIVIGHDYTAPEIIFNDPIHEQEFYGFRKSVKKVIVNKGDPRGAFVPA